MGRRCVIFEVWLRDPAGNPQWASGSLERRPSLRSKERGGPEGVPSPGVGRATRRPSKGELLMTWGRGSRADGRSWLRKHY